MTTDLTDNFTDKSSTAALETESQVIKVANASEKLLSLAFNLEMAQRCVLLELFIS